MQGNFSYPTVVTVGRVTIDSSGPLALIAGPCQLESRDHALMVASRLAALCDRLSMGFIFKSSFDKANRTSVHSKRGVGLEQGLRIFEEVRREIGCPIITDVHHPEQCAVVAESVDILQIPAFLCRQTDLLLAAAKTGCVINVKKGQFVAPWDMGPVVEKLRSVDPGLRVLLTERGTSFGYNQLVSDMRSLTIMREATGCPIVFDATHSVQQPGGMGHASGGQRCYVSLLARAAVAVGVAAVFLETHEDPDSAPSDGPCMVPLEEMDRLLTQLQAIDRLVKAKA